MSNNTEEVAGIYGAETFVPAGKRRKISLIGAGNVATHLGVALSKVADVVQVVSRSMDSAQRLSRMIGGECRPGCDLEDLAPDSDLYLLSVNDDGIAAIAAATPDYPGIWAHTSGSVPAEVFADCKSSYGVFYPLQTFTRDVPVNISEVPFFIEGNSPETSEKLMSLARMLSPRVEYADSRRRRHMHVAAVFACNYADLMWLIADELLKKEGLDITYMMPLLKATLEKLNDVSPREAMTGPARRGDREVIRKHIEMLSGNDREIYRMLADRILEEFPCK